MTTITTLYSVGEVVWHANTTQTTATHDCPDCLGSGSWSATSPAGAEFSVACPRCSGVHQSNRALSLSYATLVGTATRLTIGSVRFDSAEVGARYMCKETGVGSGRVYDESDLFSTQEDAQGAADAKAIKNAAEITWIAEQYKGSLQFCDYQLESALAKDARSSKISNGVKVQMLFEDLRDCETMQEMRERLEEGFGE
jgi:hypothetical protein